MSLLGAQLLTLQVQIMQQCFIYTLQSVFLHWNRYKLTLITSKIAIIELALQCCYIGVLLSNRYIGGNIFCGRDRSIDSFFIKSYRKKNL